MGDRPRALPAGSERPGRLRGRRRALSVGQAHRKRCGRGVDGGAVRAPVPGDALGASMTTLDALRTAPLFAQLPEADLRRLAEMAEPLSLAPGELLLREGDPGDAMYAVVSGELDVTKRSGGNEIQLARVGAGTIQGEMSAIEGRPRSASVRAITQVEVLRIPRQALLAVFALTPEAAFSVLQVVLNRLRSTESLLCELLTLAEQRFGEARRPWYARRGARARAEQPGRR